MATNVGRKNHQLAQAALAKSNTVSLSIESVYEADRQKFGAMSQDLGITFDTNNNVATNAIKSDTALNTSHRGTIGNPHGTTAADIGLGSVDNTSDNTKATLVGNPIKDALDLKQDIITGYTGNIAVVTGVDFVGQTTTTQTVAVVNGVITGVS